MSGLDDLRARVANRKLDLDRLLVQVVDHVAAAQRADRATLYVVDRVANQLISRAAHLPETAEIRLRIGEGVAGKVAQTGQPVRSRAGEAARRTDAITGYRTENLLAVPVRDQAGATLAVLEVVNKRTGSFNRADQTRLETLATQVADLLLASSLGSQLGPGQRQPLAFRFNGIVGESPPMQRVFDRISRAAATGVTVLIRGESGTGKELLAQAVHDNSPRRCSPFVKVDCAALPRTLVENELFGHKKGSYTGADRAAQGRVAQAENGTLMLDEVTEVPVETQGKLLRLLQDREYHRVGGRRLHKADVRFVCATNRDLEAEVEAGSFRNDLYYRIRVVEITVPSLRERGHADLDRLIDHFLVDLARRHDRGALTLSTNARNALHGHPWPGNVRELQHCIESAVVLAPGSEIGVDELSIATAGTDGLWVIPENAFVTGVRPLRAVEQNYMRHVLALNNGNRSATARLLQIGRSTLQRKLAEPTETD